MNYLQIIEDGVWLEDAGNYSRYATSGEDSTWVCHDCERHDVNPDERDCGCYFASYCDEDE